jgi:hypothetical protein
MQYMAQIQGGIGPDVWDRDIFIDAADFMDAAQQASANANDLGGQVTFLDQCDCSEDEALDRAVGRFLSWPLPRGFAPDAGVTFSPGHVTPISPLWPTGTNLLNAIEAREMIRRVLGVV